MKIYKDNEGRLTIDGKGTITFCNNASGIEVNLPNTPVMICNHTVIGTRMNRWDMSKIVLSFWWSYMTRKGYSQFDSAFTMTR